MATAKVKSYKRRTKTGKTVTVKQHSRKMKEGVVIDGVKPTRYKGVDTYVMAQRAPSEGAEYKRMVDASTKPKEEIAKIWESDKQRGFARPNELKTKEDWRKYREGTFKSKPTITRQQPQAKKASGDYFDEFIGKLNRIINKSRRK